VPTALFVSLPLGIFQAIFRPAIWIFNGAGNWILKHLLRFDPVAETELAHSEDELRVIVAETQKALEVSPLEKEILLNALDLRHLTVRDIMTPRSSVVFLDVESLADSLRRAKISRHTRFPLCRGHLDETIGLVHIKDLLSLVGELKPELASVKRELLMVPQMMTLPRLLKRMLGQHAHMALALDEFGGAAGIVTFEDVMEQLVGEIQDEFDSEEPAFRRLTENGFW
jgi:CBS domain containing-hemolysin-like protein